MAVLLIWGMLAGTGLADSSAIGTWEGEYTSGSHDGIIFNWNLTSGNSVTGCWEEPLEPWGLSGTAEACVSGTYSFNSQTAALSLEGEGWTYNVSGHDAHAYLSVTGTIDGDSAAGSSEVWLDIYLDGTWVDGDYAASTWQATRTSTPAKPTNPKPGSPATNQSMIADLSWSNGGGATSYNVYFGTDSTPDNGEYKGNQSGRSYDPGTLARGTTYYWRVDAKNSNGTVTGDIWSFTTVGTIYVDGVNGSDLSGNGSELNPYKTVQKALQMATNGHRIIIFAGTYPQNITINKQLTIEAHGGLVRIGQ